MGYKSFCQIPWEFDFENLTQILKLRGLPPYTWILYSQNHLMYKSYYADHFDMYIRGTYLIKPQPLVGFPITSFLTVPLCHKTWTKKCRIFRTFNLCQKFGRGCPAAQTPTQKFKIGFLMVNSQDIGSGLVSFQMVCEALQF